MTDLLRPHHDLLARAVEALRNAPIPTGPPPATVARTLRRLHGPEAESGGRPVWPDCGTDSPEHNP